MSQSNIASFVGPNGGALAPVATSTDNEQTSWGGLANSGSWAPNSNNLSGEYVDSNENSMNPLFYEQAANTGTTEAAAFYNQAAAANAMAAPTVNNVTGAQSRAALGANQAGYSTLNADYANTLAGRGINAGAATQAAGQTNDIAAQLTAAHSGRGGQGGYSLGNAYGGMAQGVGAQGALSSQAANATGSQMNAADGGLGSSLSGQGGQLLSTSAANYTYAQQVANLQAQQDQMNQQQALSLYGQSTAEQGQYLNAVNDYGAQAEAALRTSVGQQQINNAQYNQQMGAITGAIPVVGGLVNGAAQTGAGAEDQSTTDAVGAEA
jgi:hypothetical protein